MKKREIEKFIKEDVRRETPDILDRINLDEIEIKEKSRRSILRRLLKPVMIPAFALSALAILLIAIISIGEEPGNDILPGNGTIAYSEKDEAYTLSALSAISLLSQIESNGNQHDALLFRQLSFSDSGRVLLLDEHLDQLNRNLNMIEPLIGDSNNMRFSLSHSEMPEYEYQMVFTTQDMRGRSIAYTMHYNETEEDENTYILEGIMTIGTVTYRLTGELELDDDEFELTLMAEHPQDEDTYVEIYQEVTNDEHTLEYEVVRNGDTLYESKLSIEIDGDEITLEFEYETETISISFEIERRTVDGRFVYYIEYDIEAGDEDEDGDIVVEIVYNASEERFYYRYSIETDEHQVIRYKRRVGLVD